MQPPTPLPLPPLAPTPPSIEWYERAPDLGYGRCAVVGSGAVLRGRGLGSEIDAHDTVVHVNKIPTEALWADMGNRTDVLFNTLCAVHEVDHSDLWPDDTEQWPDIGIRIGMQGGDQEIECSSRGDCWGIKAVIFRNYNRDSCGGDRSASWIKEAARNSHFALGFSADFISTAAHYLQREGSPYCCDPSTGFHAALTMAFACESVQLFGFGGDSTIDGHHGGNVGHGIEAEHALLHVLARHQLTASELGSTFGALWPRAQLIYDG